MVEGGNLPSLHNINKMIIVPRDQMQSYKYYIIYMVNILLDHHAFHGIIVYSIQMVDILLYHHAFESGSIIVIVVVHMDYGVNIIIIII